MDAKNTHAQPPKPINRVSLDPDQRRSERLIVALPITYVVEVGGRQLIGDAETLNISGGGVQFLLPSPVPASSSCLIHITLPNQPQPVSFRGTILRCQEGAGEYGVQHEAAVAWTTDDIGDEDAFARYCTFVATEMLKKYLP